MRKPIFDRVTIIGLGLIGSSLCHVIRQEGLAKTIAGSAKSEATLKTAERLNLCDALYADPAEAAADADLIILCSPIGTYGPLAEKIAPVLKPGVIVSDVGSVKGAVVRDIGPHMPEGVHFIPGHPVAGTEHSGPESGFAELFDGRWTILTPLPDSDPQAVEKLKAFWERCGSLVEIMTPEHHDLVLAITSHVPHLIAYNIVGTASDLETVTEKEVMKFSAGGFRDFTRIAASDPTMWRDVFLNNKEAVLEMLGRFTEDLTELQRAIRWGHGDKLFDKFSQTRAIRRGIIEAGQETADPDFGRKHGKPKDSSKKSA